MTLFPDRIQVKQPYVHTNRIVHMSSITVMYLNFLYVCY